MIDLGFDSVNHRINCLQKIGLFCDFPGIKGPFCDDSVNPSAEKGGFCVFLYGFGSACLHGFL